MSSAQLYDTIEAACTVTRRTEPQIAEQVWAVPSGSVRTISGARQPSALIGLPLPSRSTLLSPNLIWKT
jgi:hypothetical protein